MTQPNLRARATSAHSDRCLSDPAFSRIAEPAPSPLGPNRSAHERQRGTAVVAVPRRRHPQAGYRQSISVRRPSDDSHHTNVMGYSPGRALRIRPWAPGRFGNHRLARPHRKFARTGAFATHAARKRTGLNARLGAFLRFGNIPQRNRDVTIRECRIRITVSSLRRKCMMTRSAGKVRASVA